MLKTRLLQELTPSGLCLPPVQGVFPLSKLRNYAVLFRMMYYVWAYFLTSPGMRLHVYSK